MLKPLLISASLSGSLLVGSFLWQEIQPDVENTVSYTSVENVIKNASFLRDLGTENAVFLSYSEVVKDIPNLIYNATDNSIEYRTETSCNIAYLTDNSYKISVC